MSRKSTIERLDPAIRDLIGSLREQGRTIDEILDKLRELAVDVSRSALGRHTQKLDDLGKRLRESRELAEALVRRYGEGDEARTLRLNVELLHAQLMDLIAAGDEHDPKAVSLLARALRDLAGAAKTDADQAIRIRRELTEKAAEKAEAAGKREGLSAEALARIRADIYGLAG